MSTRTIEDMKRYISPMTDTISDAVMDYVKKNFSEDKIHIDFILNLLASAHMSSLSNLMRYIARDSPHVLKNVEAMLDEIAKALGVIKMKHDGTILN